MLKSKECPGNPNVNHINQPIECMYCEYWEDGCLKVGKPKRKSWFFRRLLTFISDWLIILRVLLILVGVLVVYRLPPKAAQNPQIEQLQAIETRLERIEGRVQEIYETQTTQVYQETLRRGY